LAVAGEAGGGSGGLLRKIDLSLQGNVLQEIADCCGRLRIVAEDRPVTAG